MNLKVGDRLRHLTTGRELEVKYVGTSQAFIESANGHGYAVGQNWETLLERLPNAVLVVNLYPVGFASFSTRVEADAAAAADRQHVLTNYSDGTWGVESYNGAVIKTVEAAQ